MISYIYNKKVPHILLERLTDCTFPREWAINHVLFAERFIEKYHLCLVGDALLSKKMIYFYNEDTGLYEFGRDERLSYFIQRELPDTMVSANVVKNLLVLVKNNVCKEVCMDEDENIINFANGILDLETLQLHPHSPIFFTTIQIDCNWNPDAPYGEVFENFMEFFCNKEGASDYEGIRKMILKFFGVAISNVHGYRLKKGLFFVGAGNTGKTQLKGLCERIIGSKYVMGLNLKAIEGRWGLGNCYNKRIVGSNDQSFQDLKELSNFKQITGGDYVFAELKGVDGFTFRYTGIVWICSNALPTFEGDKGKHVYDRLVIYEPTNVIAEDKKDKKLQDKMLLEKEYIVYHAVLALKELIDDDFDLKEPACIKSKRNIYEVENNTILSFMRECVIIVEGLEEAFDLVSTKTFYDIYVEWCRENNFGKSMRKKDLTSHLKELGLDEICYNDAGYRFYKHITVDPSILIDYRDNKNLNIKLKERDKKDKFLQA